MRKGTIAGHKWITCQLRSTKTTSIANRMATVCIACDGMMSRPVPGSSPRLPNNPTSRRRLVPATVICSPSTVFLVVFRTATASASILLSRSHALSRAHTFPSGHYDRQYNQGKHSRHNPNHHHVIPIVSPLGCLSAKTFEHLHHGKYRRSKHHHKKCRENEDGQGKDQFYGGLSRLLFRQHHALD